MAGGKKKGKKATASTSASTSAAPRTAIFTASDLIRRVEASGSEWADQLAVEAGLDSEQVYQSTGGDDHFTGDSCYALGCLLVVELLKQGRLQSDASIPALVDEHSSKEALSEIKEAAKTLDTARASFDERLEKISADVVSVQLQLEQAKEAPKAALQALEAKKEGKRSILLAGLVSEGVNGQQAAEQVAEFIRSEVQPALPVDVVSVARMGRFSEQMQGSRRLKVEFASEVQASAVLRAAFHLKAFNQKLKKSGKQPVGLDPFLSKEEVALKLRLKSRFDAERAKGTPKVYFRGCHLFVSGREVLP